MMPRRLFVLGALFGFARPADARLVEIHEEHGNRPQQSAHTPGTLPLVNRPSRLFLRHWIGFGQQDYQFYYKGGPAVVTEVVRLFADVSHPTRSIRLSAREAVTFTHDEKKTPVRYEVCFRDVDRYQEPKSKYLELTVHLTAVAVPPADPAKVWPLVADLDSPRYPVRDAADRALAKLGRTAKPVLREARMTADSPEVRTRLDGLLAKLNGLAVDDLDLPAGLTVAADFKPEEAARHAVHADVERFVAEFGRRK